MNKNDFDNQEYTQAMKNAEQVLLTTLSAVQELFKLDSFELYAVAAQALGGSLGCNDAHLEKAENITYDDDMAQPFRKTFLINMEIAYNEHRAAHERFDCVKKPKPKIV